MFIAPKWDPWGQAGESLGQGLSEGLNALTQLKLQSMQQSEERKQLGKGLAALAPFYPGKTPEQLAALQDVPTSLLAPLISQTLKPAATNAQLATPEALEPLVGKDLAAAISRLPGNQQPIALRDALSKRGDKASTWKVLVPGVTDAEAEAIAKASPGVQQVFYKQSLEGGFKPEAPVVTEPTGAVPAQPKEVVGTVNQPVAPEKPKEVAPKSTVQKIQEAAAAKKTVEAQAKTHRQSLLDTKKDREEIYNANKAAIETDDRLKRMEELTNKGNLQNPLLNQVLDKLGLNFDALKSADTTEMEKLTNDFLRGARSIFGARVTNYEIQKFLSSIPRLSLTKEGRLAVIRNLKLMNKYNHMRFDEMQKIKKENKGDLPIDFKELIEERLDPEYKKMAEEFAAGVAPEQGEEVNVIARSKTKPPVQQYKGDPTIRIRRGKTTWKPNDDFTDWVEE
jgi:hypothetical protein